MNHKIIAVIVLYYPSEEKIKHIRNEIFRQVDNIIYIDNTPNNNNSKIYNIDTMKEHIIKNKENLGIAFAQNQGIRKAVQLQGTHILLLDQDSIPTPKMVDELTEGFKQKKNVGLVGCTSINAFDSSIDNTGIVVKGVCLKKIPIKERYHNVSYTISSGSLIPIKVFEEVGLMREDMFIDGVDFEWCLRAKAKGYIILQARDAHLIHELGNGSKDKVLNHSPLREYYIMQNSLRMIGMNHIPIGYRLRRVLMSIGRMITNCRQSRFEYFRQDMRALRDLFK